MTLLEMHDVSKSFPAPNGCVGVLERVNLDLSEGEFLIITGPSGSGKTTLLHLASLLDRPSSGKVIFDSLDVSTLDERDLCRIRKHKVGMVFQKYCLLPHRSVRENILFRFRYLDHDPADAASRTELAMAQMGLMEAAERPARLLSGGEMQRVAIARAVALEPRLLIADEPTGNLDRSSADAVMACFHRLNQAGITILMVSHNEALLEHCSRHLVCQDGFVHNGFS